MIIEKKRVAKRQRRINSMKDSSYGRTANKKVYSKTVSFVQTMHNINFFLVTFIKQVIKLI